MGEGRAVGDETARDRILADAEEEHRAWAALLGGLRPEEATARPEGAWSAVDALVHVTAWKENAPRVARLQTAPSAPEIDLVHEELLSALAALPEERLLGGRGRHGARRWCALPAMSHPLEHRNQLQRRFTDSAAATRDRIS
jgi:hypothetical protein